MTDLHDRSGAASLSGVIRPFPARGFVLSCCSTADLPPDFFTRRRISYIPFHFTLDGQEYPDDLGQTLPFGTFYKALAGGSAAKSSQVNVREYHDYFEGFLKRGFDVLHVSFSSGLSGSCRSAVTAAELLGPKYPDRRLEIVDSLAASSGYGLLMDELADLRDGGASFDELLGFAETQKLRLHHWFFSGDLTAYIRGGRVSKAAGFVGGALGICPILRMDRTGHLTPHAKALSKRKAIRDLVARMVEHADGGREYAGKCMISHSDCFEDARALADLIEATFPRLSGPVVINSVGTVIGAHTGPGTVALFFMGDVRV